MAYLGIFCSRVLLLIATLFLGQEQAYIWATILAA